MQACYKRECKLAWLCNEDRLAGSRDSLSTAAGVREESREHCPGGGALVRMHRAGEVSPGQPHGA